jgi:hypothetical protein
MSMLRCNCNDRSGHTRSFVHVGSMSGFRADLCTTIGSAMVASRVLPLSQLNAFLAQPHLSEPLMIIEPEISL